MQGPFPPTPCPEHLEGAVPGCCHVPPHPALRPQETVQLLQAKVNVLDAAVLDQVEARLQVRGGRKEGTVR